MATKKERKYIPGLAALNFKPKDYWEPNKAEKMFLSSARDDIDKIDYCDCVSGIKSMPENSVDLIIADPPFGIKFSGKQGAYNRNSNLVMDSYHEVEKDYGVFAEEWIKYLYKIMKPHATAYIFSGWNHLEDILRASRLAGLTLINHIIWKYQFGVFTQKKFVTSHYHILMLAKNQDSYYFNKIEHYPLDVWDIKRKYNKGEEKNATTLPIDVVKKCIEFSSKPGDLVFDPFMGMGTTAVVSKSLWRHYYGFEINSKMESIIEKRINSTSAGELYVTLDQRIDETQNEVKKKYPLIYKKYMSEREVVLDV